MFFSPSAIFSDPGNTKNVNLHFVLQISDRDTGRVVGIVQDVQKNRNGLEDDDENYHVDDLPFADIMGDTVTSFHTVWTGIDSKVDGQGHIFSHNYQEVENLSQKCRLVFVSDTVEEIIVIVRVEASHWVEQDTDDVADG